MGWVFSMLTLVSLDQGSVLPGGKSQVVHCQQNGIRFGFNLFS